MIIIDIKKNKNENVRNIVKVGIVENIFRTN